MPLVLHDQYIQDFVPPHQIEEIWPHVVSAHQQLHSRSGPGNRFLGWMDLPVNYDQEELARVRAAAGEIAAHSDAFVVIGVGGSSLGARAAIEFIQSPNYNLLPKDTPDIYFCGNSFNPEAIVELVELCRERSFSVNVVSKSGTTAESALAFRVFRTLLEEKYGKEGARRRIFCTTDAKNGKLKELADKEGYETFAVPDGIGGRFSVLTAVGLLPAAVAGCDIEAIMQGAREARAAYMAANKENDCYRYAAYRNLLYANGKQIEVLVSYDPALAQTAEWFKQLFGESEGKGRRGLFPTAMTFSTDLHSMGQFVQDGAPILFETVLNLQAPKQDFYIGNDREDIDGLNYLSGQSLSAVNTNAMRGTLLAHVESGTPNMMLNIPRRNSFEFGWLVYFFEKACAISGYLLGVNPFDQPGVEQYKANMLALLGKPGLEDLRAALQAKL